MNQQSYEVIVIGLGAMGSATVAHLAERGVRALGLDSYPPVHSFGSSHGGSRIIREAYFEAPDYVPLVQRSYDQWRQLEAVTGRNLLRITGGLCFGPPDEQLVVGAQRSAEIHNLPYERLSPDQVTTRFPGFTLPENMVAIYEPHAGILDPEGGVAAHLHIAATCGADLHYEEAVLRWSADGAGVRVETAAGSYSAGHLIITAGPWAGQVLEELHLPLEVQRIVNVYFEPERLEHFTPDQCPIYLFHVPEGLYYGFPYLQGQGLKAGRHDGGEVCTPQTIRRTVDEQEVAMLRAALNQYMPGSAGRALKTATCMYTMTPDEHFILDHHPSHPQVVFGAGFSGHGYKFAPVIGEILADLALDGSTDYNIKFLSLSRLGAR
jgi:sarcosine oxidase